MARVRIVDLVKRYGDQVAVDHLDLEVQEGEFVTLLGPSGCGKTTTLRAIAGLVEIDSGEIWFDGRLMNDVSPNRRYTAMVFQSYALFPHMSVAANIEFGLRMRKVSSAERRRRTDEVMAMVGLDGLANRRPGELSGGQQQRVALARAIVTQPEVLLFDEPLSNLDAKLRERLRIEIRDLQRRLGVTSVYVTHDQAEAMVMSDRIVVMNSGRIEQMGDPYTIYTHPATQFTAAFIGQVNIVEGRVLSSDASSCLLETPVGRLRAGAVPPPAKQKLLVSWRPEDMLPFAPGMGNRIEARLVHNVFMGNLTDLMLEANGVSLRAQCQGSVAWQAGEEVVMGIDESRITVLV